MINREIFCKLGRRSGGSVTDISSDERLGWRVYVMLLRASLGCGKTSRASVAVHSTGIDTARAVGSGMVDCLTRYNTRCCFNVQLNADKSQLWLPHRTNNYKVKNGHAQKYR